jgi:predicted thioredoxin/glutaredoxin
MADKVAVEIPKADPKEIVQIPKGELGDMKKKFEQLDKIIIGLLVTVVLSAAAIVITAVGVFLDQMRFNAAAYQEYSEKNDAIIELRNTNQELLKTNQQTLNKLLELEQRKSQSTQ